MDLLVYKSLKRRLIFHLKDQHTSKMFLFVINAATMDESQEKAVEMFRSRILTDATPRDNAAR